MKKTFLVASALIPALFSTRVLAQTSTTHLFSGHFCQPENPGADGPNIWYQDTGCFNNDTTGARSVLCPIGGFTHVSSDMTGSFVTEGNTVNYADVMYFDQSTTDCVRGQAHARLNPTTIIATAIKFSCSTVTGCSTCDASTKPFTGEGYLEFFFPGNLSFKHMAIYVTLPAKTATGTSRVEAYDYFTGSQF